MADLEYLTTEAVQASTISGLPLLAIRQLDNNGAAITTGGWLIGPDATYGLVADWVTELAFINFIDGLQLLKVRWTYAKAHWMLSQWAVAAGNSTGISIHVRTPQP